MATTVAFSGNNYHMTNDQSGLVGPNSGGDCFMPDSEGYQSNQAKVKRRASVKSTNSNHMLEDSEMERKSNLNLIDSSISSRTSSSSFSSTASSVSSSSSSLAPLTTTVVVQSNGMVSGPSVPPSYCSCASPLTLLDVSLDTLNKKNPSIYCDRCQLNTNPSQSASVTKHNQSEHSSTTTPIISLPNGSTATPNQKSNHNLSDPPEIKRNSISITNFDDQKLSMKVITNEKGEPLSSVVDITPSENKLLACNRFLKGISLTVLSALFFSITTVIVKYTNDIKPSQLACFRFIGILLFSFPVALETEKNLLGASDLRVWIILRGMAGATSLFFRYSALSYMSLADTTVIVLSMPVFVFIFARIFLKESFGRYHIVALVMSLAGIALASKLTDMFSGSDNNGSPDTNSTTTTTMSSIVTSLVHEFTSLSPKDNVESTESIQNNTEAFSVSSTDPGLENRNRLYGTLFSLGAMLVGSSVYVLIRKIRSTHHSIILFNFAWVAIIEMLAINYIFYDFHIPTEGWTPWLVTLLAIFSFYGQLLLTKAIQIEEAGVVSVIRVSSEALFAFVFQIVLFKEIPDVYSISGAVLVLSSVMLLSFRKYILSLPEGSSMRQRFKFLAI